MLAGLAATGTLATNILLPSLPQMAVSLKVIERGGHLGHHHLPGGVRAWASSWSGRSRTATAAAGRCLIGFAVFFAGSIWCGLATDLPSLLVGRVIQAAGACATSVLSRAIARDMFSGAALARAMALIMIAMAAAPGFSPLLGGALDHYFGWRSEFVLVAVFAGLGALAYGTVFGETHHATRTPLDPLAIAKNYLGLIADRRFVVPAATVSLIMGGLFSMFSAAPRILIEAMHFTPIQLGLFFAGTVLIVFAAGMLATRLAPRYGLDRSIRGGLLAAATGSIAMLLVSLYSPSFLPFLGAMSVFLLGMGIVNPLGTAQALSPFGDKAGAASALVGFWQMMTAAIGVWLAATISHEALFALGVVLTVFSLAAVGLYTLRAAGPRTASWRRLGARYRSYFPATTSSAAISGSSV